MSGATPGHWEVFGTSGYGALNGVSIRSLTKGLVLAVTIGDVPELDSKANAERIVRAVNCHDDLLTALRELQRRVDALIFRPAVDDMRTVDRDTRHVREYLETSRAAIAKATGAQS